MTTLQLVLDDESLSDLALQVGRELGHAPRYVSRSRLCDHLGITSATVKTWRTRGLPAVKVGGTLMFDLEAVGKWIESQG